MTQVFEIEAIGFDASTDATDDRVIWVAAPDRGVLCAALEGVPHLRVVATCLHPDAAGIDHHLPRDAERLRAHLTRLAKEAA